MCCDFMAESLVLRLPQGEGRFCDGYLEVKVLGQQVCRMCCYPNLPVVNKFLRFDRVKLID